jgi:hypothetical protein
LASRTFHETRGVVTNESSALGHGDLTHAFNAVCKRKGLIEQRRPLIELSNLPAITNLTQIGGLAQHKTSLYIFMDNSLEGFQNSATTGGACHMYRIPANGTPGSIANSIFDVSLPLRRDDPLSNFLPMAPNVNLPRYASMNGSLYWCAKDGIAKVAADEDTTGTLSGMSRAPDIVGITTSTGTVLPNNASVAYRVLWGVVDANDNLVRGPPSGRATYYNTSGSATNPVLTLRPPAFADS